MSFLRTRIPSPWIRWSVKCSIENWFHIIAVMAGTKRKGASKTSSPSSNKRLRSAANGNSGQAPASGASKVKVNGQATEANGTNGTNGVVKKQILLNAFDMSTVGHLSPGQWKVSDSLSQIGYYCVPHWLGQNPEDRSANKRDLKYWTDLAKTLDRGGINALFLADTYGGYDTYEGSLDNCIRRAAQWPVTDPTIVSTHDLKCLLSKSWWSC